MSCCVTVRVSAGDEVHRGGVDGRGIEAPPTSCQPGVFGRIENR